MEHDNLQFISNSTSHNMSNNDIFHKKRYDSISPLKCLLEKAETKKSPVLRKISDSMFSDEDSFDLDKFELKNSKHKIIATLDKIDKPEDDFSDYYSRIIKTNVDIIKFSFSIFDDTHYSRLKQSYKQLMKEMKKHQKHIPIIIGIQYRVMRLNNQTTIDLTARDLLHIKISNNRTIEPDSYLNTLEDKKPVYFLNNVDYFYSYKASPGDKIIIDFGKGLLTITKVYYKNGNIVKLSPEEQDTEIMNTKKYNLSKDLFKKDDLYLYDNKIIDPCDKIDNEDELSAMIDEFFDGVNMPVIYEKNHEDQIDFIEVVVNYSCSLLANRLVQVCKKKKYDRYIYIPENYLAYTKRIINEFEFDYLMLDNSNEEMTKRVYEIIQYSNKNILIMSRIGDLYALTNIKSIYKYSVGVELAMSYFHTELSFIDIVLLTEILIKLFKKKGLAVIIYSQLLESLLKQNKPSISEVFDISAFIKLGVDGFKLGLETTNHNICVKALDTLTVLLSDLQNYMPTYYAPQIKRICPITNQINQCKLIEISSTAIYNSLIKDTNIFLVVITDNNAFLSEMLHHNFYNHIILVTPKRILIKKYMLFAITYHIMINKDIITSDEKIIKYIKEDDKIRMFGENIPMLFVRDMLSESLEMFHINI